MEIGQYIRSERKKNNLTLKELANLIEISSSYLSQIELGERTVSPEFLGKIANALNLSYIDLLVKAKILDSYEEELNKINKSNVQSDELSNLYSNLLNLKNEFSNLKNHDLNTNTLIKIESIIEKITEIIDDFFFPNTNSKQNSDLNYTTAHNIIEIYKADDESFSKHYALENILNGNVNVTLNGRSLTKSEINKSLEVLSLIFND